jgi:hypothetical protein
MEIRASAVPRIVTFKRGDWKQRLTAAISPNGSRRAGLLGMTFASL